MATNENRTGHPELENEIEILWVGEAFDYPIPHSHVITVRLRHVKITNHEQWSGTDKPSTLDVFLREDSQIDLFTLPTCIRICDGCSVPVSWLLSNN